jgi:hypothetical protein
VQVTGMDVYGGLAARVTGISASIYVAGNDNLRLSRHCAQKHQQTYYGLFNFQCSNSNFQFSTILTEGNLKFPITV